MRILRTEAARAEAAQIVPEPSAADPEPSPKPERPASLLADFTRVMRIAAESERDEALERHRADADTVRAWLTNHGAEREAAILAEAEAAIARIRDEAERRVAERVALLHQRTAEAKAHVAAQIAHVDEVVARYRDDLEHFTRRLEETTDPTAFAALAAAIPAPPPFELPPVEPLPEVPAADASVAADGPPAAEPAAIDDGAAVSFLPAVIDADAASSATVAAPVPDAPITLGAPMAPAAEAAEVAEVDEVAAPAAAADAVAASAAAEPAAAAPAAAPAAAAPEQPFAWPAPAVVPPPSIDWPDEPVEVRPQAPAPAAPAPTPAAPVPASHAAPAPARPAGGPSTTSQGVATTHLRAYGLFSLAGVAHLKQQLARRAGVQSISVTSDPDGAFVFSVVHHAGLDLAEAIVTLEAFAPRIDAAEGDVVRVTVKDPDGVA
ncbi:MAG: hypothetical protein RL338_1633 [Chloroflexota bacterium]|jgi:hypothetical protein